MCLVLIPKVFIFIRQENKECIGASAQFSSVFLLLTLLDYTNLKSHKSIKTVHQNFQFPFQFSACLHVSHGHGWPQTSHVQVHPTYFTFIFLFWERARLGPSEDIDYSKGPHIVSIPAVGMKSRFGKTTITSSTITSIRSDNLRVC